MIVSAEKRTFVPKEASGLLTSDGRPFACIEDVFVQSMDLNACKVKRVYLGEGVVYEEPRSYFFINLVS